MHIYCVLINWHTKFTSDVTLWSQFKMQYLIFREFKSKTRHCSCHINTCSYSENQPQWKLKKWIKWMKNRVRVVALKFKVMMGGWFGVRNSTCSNVDIKNFIYIQFFYSPLTRKLKLTSQRAIWRRRKIWGQHTNIQCLLNFHLKHFMKYSSILNIQQI